MGTKSVFKKLRALLSSTILGLLQSNIAKLASLH